MRQHKSIPCPACHGRGTDECTLCSGSGRHFTTINLKGVVNVAAIVAYALALLAIVAAVAIYLPLLGEWLHR
jgi:hypothetical protein